jgi:hypothetical protein
MPKMHGAAVKVLLQTQGGKIPHTERSKQISAHARNFETRLLAQIPMIRGKHGRDDVLLPSHAGIAQKGNKK